MPLLAEIIGKIVDPTPKVVDPEDDVNIETSARISNKDKDSDAELTISTPGRKTPFLIEDVDPRYAGHKISRKLLDNIFHEERKTSSNVEDDENDVSSEKPSDLDSSGGESEEDDNGDDKYLSDSDLNAFKELFKAESGLNDKVPSLDDEEETSESESADDEESNQDVVQQFSNIDVTSDIEKGKAVKAQQEIWNRLCECRIKLQKLLILANKLPQSDRWQSLTDKGGKPLAENLNKGCSSIKMLLNNWLDLQSVLLAKNPENSNLENTAVNVESESDEEIHSDEAVEEMEEKSKTDDIKIDDWKPRKRKAENQDYCEILAKRHKSLIPYRNSVIQKWDEKTRLSTGRITQKSFTAFENSALKQIEKILQDKNRLIKRTQLKRSLYRVLGKPEFSQMKNDENADVNESVSKQDMLLKDYDPEIFDDDDFYRQLLKDVIESQSVGIDREVLRKQMEIQKIRNKMKRKVDTKASKGRRLRYDVHPKLANFMASIQTTKVSDETRDNVLKCLFGKSSVTS
ncbi:protein AATF-like [Stegodyphus dumicola]|uniref:protein AATF-like n=1 Tax=Stegodyphus dumicola TaxID=202533 RepID=UPI0015A99E52|nr:protein AATF-like [Stegodyphus dumicola]